MKISITLLALATLFHTALGGCGYIKIQCETNNQPSKVPMTRLLECHDKSWNRHSWDLKEDCAASGKICINDPGKESYCGDGWPGWGKPAQ